MKNIVFATTDSRVLSVEGIFEFVQIEDVYFIYNYRTAENDNSLYGKAESVQTWLARQCTYPEQFPILTEAQDVLMISVDGHVFVNGYDSGIMIWDTTTLRAYVNGSTFVAVRVVPSTQVTFYPYARYKYTNMVVLAVNDVIAQVLYGIQNDQVLAQFREDGFVVGKEVVLPDNETRMVAVTGSKLHPIAIQHKNDRQVITHIADLSACIPSHIQKIRAYLTQ